MNSLNQLVFANTCGKIFPDKIVLATSNSEKTLEMSDIGSLSFRKTISLSGLLFAIVPAALVAMAYTLSGDETFLRAIFMIVGGAGVIMSFIKAKRQYTLSVKEISGQKHSINVWEGNAKEAGKFAERVNDMVKRYRNSRTAETYEQLQRVVPVTSFE